MPDATSRYARCETAEFVLSDGRVVPYLRRRLAPLLADQMIVGTGQAQPDERVDTLAARLLGDPLQYWRLCDAGEVMDPAELIEPGAIVRLAMPQA